MHVQWQAVDEAGQNRQGEMQSMSLALARAQLRRQGLQVTRLKRLWWRPVPRIHLRDTAQVTRQLATLLQAGVPLLQALDMLMHGMPQVAWREPLQDIASQVMAGRSLHEALARHPRIFSPLYRHMVAAGEMAGALDQTLLRLADTLERNERLQARLRAALMYPAIVLCVALAVVMLIMLWVVPVFEEVFRAFGASLPLPTQILIELSHGLAQAGLPLLLFGVMAVSGSRQPAVRRRLATWSDQWLPRLPLIGALLKLSVLARWCQPLSVWRSYFAGWVNQPDPMAQMLASVMFDLRPIAGAASPKAAACTGPWPASPAFRSCWRRCAPPARRPVRSNRCCNVQATGLPPTLKPGSRDWAACSSR